VFIEAALGVRCCSIMMDKMTKVLSIDNDKKQLRVQAQMNLKDLYATADANSMSTPRSALPWWQGLTLAGVFATSSHGTGNNATSIIVSACSSSHTTLACLSTRSSSIMCGLIVADPQQACNQYCCPHMYSPPHCTYVTEKLQPRCVVLVCLACSVTGLWT
jgi:hypothetical protein